SRNATPVPLICISKTPERPLLPGRWMTAGSGIRCSRLPLLLFAFGGGLLQRSCGLDKLSEELSFRRSSRARSALEPGGQRSPAIGHWPVLSQQQTELGDCRRKR